MFYSQGKREGFMIGSGDEAWALVAAIDQQQIFVLGNVIDIAPSGGRQSRRPGELVPGQVAGCAPADVPLDCGLLARALKAWR